MPEHENKYTVVEVIDEKTQHGPLTVTGALVNGQPVRVAARGVEVSYDIPSEGKDAESFVMVTLTLLVDEFHIHRAQRYRDETPLTEALDAAFRTGPDAAFDGVADGVYPEKE